MRKGVKKYSYSEPGGERGECNEWFTVTEEEILEDRWEFYKERLGDKATKEGCIAEWIEDRDAMEIWD